MSTKVQDLFDLSGQVALVTGGSRGLGLQIAESLGEAGAKIMLSSRKAADLEEAVAHLQSRGIDARWVAADSSDPGQIQHVVDETMHRLGRIDHVPLTATQNEADPRRMEWILARHEVFHAEMEPGDALFFHCNTLHRSDANRSPHRRWTLLLCYNAARNDALRREDDRSYVPLDKVDDGAIRRAGLRFASGAGAEHFTSRPYVPDVGAAERQPGR